MNITNNNTSVFPKNLKALFSIASFLGFVCFAVGLSFMESQRVWSAVLVSSIFVLFLSLGGLFFLAIHHASKAVWSTNLRRLMEAFTQYLPIGLFVALILALVGGPSLYIWMDPEMVAKDHLLSLKAPYLNWPFFLVRLLICFGLWIFFSKWLLNYSLKQDKGEVDEESFSKKSFKISIAFLGAFAITFTVFSVDSLMSLDPHWFSTIFGVYCFAGLFQSFVAALALLVIYLKKQGLLQDLVSENHLHDLGKFLFGCSIFWAYIAFSQYMLIWYANLPEEALYYYHRLKHNWKWMSLSLIVFKFALPFLFLLPRWVKRDARSLGLVSVLVLIMQYVDIYWMVYPQYDSEHIRFGFLELGLGLGFVAMLLYSIFRFLEAHPIVPLKDPGSHTSARHVVTY